MTRPFGLRRERSPRGRVWLRAGNSIDSVGAAAAELRGRDSWQADTASLALQPAWPGGRQPVSLRSVEHARQVLRGLNRVPVELVCADVDDEMCGLLAESGSFIGGLPLSIRQG